ncbi:acyltransferase [Umezawaea sp. Da 62-37]|uniref:acyltransferase family protein n=1 Tax=Umezawaea sp. Da 62-37 TaxID=3075927 RepID=UPI0028F719D5|nr:acyltransferase [Umezawaea sp. Da 62-37]WNV85721.1 acyltransferase [Umezawaea sp. Da 62-37]
MSDVERTPVRLSGLDGLRGIAVAGVLLFHAGRFGGGFLGVDLFFALSGYLITDLLLREVRASGTVSLVAFWGRRFRRLLPALTAALAGTTLAVWALGDAELRTTALADGPWVQANLVNWHLLAESAGYWDRFGPGRVFGHLSSIAVEEQFYLVWPVVVLLVAGTAKRVEHRVALVAAVTSVLSLALMVVLFTPDDPTRVYTGTDTRAFSLLLGAAAATGPVRRAVSGVVGRHVVPAQAVVAGALAVLWLSVDGEGAHWLFQGGLFVHSLLAALLILLCALAPDSVVTGLFGRAPLRLLGLVSYSLYLWHWPVFLVLSEDRLGLDGWARTAVVCAVSLVLAVLSKVLVEDPIRFRARWARGRAGLVALAATTVVLAVLWAAVPRPPVTLVDVGDLHVSRSG